MKVCIDVDWQKHEVCLSEPLDNSVTVIWTLHLGNSAFAVTGEGKLMAVLTVNQFVALSVELQDQFGNHPAPFATGSGRWSVSDPTAAEIRNVSDDGLTAAAIFWPLGPVPAVAVRVTFNCDRDPNTPGEQPLATDGFVDFTLLPGEGVTAVINVGTPTTKP